MDSERPRTSARLAMQLHRDDEYGKLDNKTDRPSTMTARPQTRIERPVSRRGTQNDLTRDNNSYRAGTPIAKTPQTRPPSSLVNANRGSTPSTRLNTISSSMGIKRVNTGLPPTSQVSYNLIDRPITQQGVAAIRPGTTRGLPMSRQIQDKRYYEGLIQVKIRELTNEIGTITREIDSQNRERATFIHYDNRAKELAAELTDLQGKLADLNIVIDKVTSNIDKETIKQEAANLRELNDKLSTEVDKFYEQRISKEQHLRDMEEQINLEKKEERIIESMKPEIRIKYDKLINQRNELENDISTMQKNIDLMSNEKISLEEQIALSQVKQEVVKLKLKITEVEDKRKKLQDELKNKLSPDEERERLLAKVKQDNMDIVAAERRMEDAKKHINELEQELEQIENDMEENYSEKQAKYIELRKREEAIEQFMPSFDDNKTDELEKIEKLESNIVDKLQQLSFSIDHDSGSFTDEMAILNFSSPTNDQSQDVDRSFEGLSKEYIRLQYVIIKMKALEKKLKSEIIERNDTIYKKQNELIVLEDLDGLKTRTDEQHKELLQRKDDLKIKYPKYEKELLIIKKEYDSLKNQLDKNETYLQINALEEKHDKLKENNEKIEKLINEERDSVNYQPLKQQTFSLVTKYNVFLQQNTKRAY